MDKQQWNKIEELFNAALELEEAERAEFLEQACGDSAALRQEVESLLDYKNAQETFLKNPPINEAARLLEKRRVEFPVLNWDRYESVRFLGEEGRGKVCPTNDPKLNRDVASYYFNASMSDSPHKIGPYTILGVLGKGGMGIVYRGKHAETGELAAVKTVLVPNEIFLTNIRREIRVLARIQHPGVIRVLAEGVENGLPWYAMQLLEGTTLRRYFINITDDSEEEDPTKKKKVPQEATSKPSVTQSFVAPSLRWWTDSLSMDEESDTTGLFDFDKGDFDSTADVAHNLDMRSPTVASHSFPLRLPRPSASHSLSPEYVRAVLTMIRHLCAPLSFLHGEGIIHRDLKPDNILVGSNGMPIVVDFGLMSQFSGNVGREVLEVSGGVAGTVMYMAPEQIKGELLDARADLYSLGCILYELLTERPPFVGTFREIIQGHLESMPAPPSQLAEGVPAELDKLVLKLLAKRPHDRVGYASDLSVMLAELGAGVGVATAGPHPRDYLYRPEFTGRDNLLQELDRLLLCLKKRTGGLVLLGGESGIGKTRLAMEIARRAESSGIHVLAGQSSPLYLSDKDKGGIGTAPLQPFKCLLQSIADRCRERGQSEVERILGRRGKVLALYESTLADLPGLEAYAEPAEIGAEAARIRVLNYLAETTAALANEEQLLIILDDLQWADDLTIEFLEFLLRGEYFDRMSVVILGTFQVEEINEVFRRVADSPGTRRFELGPLDEKSIKRIVGDMLAITNPPSIFARFLARHSEGNPFFIAEYLRTAVGEGVLFRDSLGHWQVAEGIVTEATETMYDTLPLPNSVRSLMERRLEKITVAAKRLAELASTIGREVDEALLADGFGKDPIDALGELLSLHILKESDVGLLQFVHDEIREIVYERLAQDRRQELHYKVAEAIEVRFREKRNDYLAILGHHWERAGVEDKARECYLEGARKAASLYLHREAERLYWTYLNLVKKPTSESVSVRNEFARRVFSLRGQKQEAIWEYRCALEEARRLGDKRLQGSSLQGLATMYRDIGRMEEARLCFEQALAILREVGDRKDEGIALCNFGALIWLQGRSPEAKSTYEQALEILREVGDRQFEAITLNRLGCIWSEQGLLAEGRTLFEQSLMIFREIGDKANEAPALNNIGFTYLLEGRLDKAEEPFEQALALFREVGDRRSEGIALENLAAICLDKGPPDEALALFKFALAIHRETGNKFDEAQTLYTMATVERQVRGEFFEVRKLLDDAEAIFKKLGNPVGVASCLCERGHIELAHGRAANELLEQAQKLVLSPQGDTNTKVEKALTRLARAVDAFNQGRPLFRGECAEDLPKGIHRWLLENGQLEQ
jgi:serine/threonine protein kinase/tetratricopeptide (TPR) repeat protein